MTEQKRKRIRRMVMSNCIYKQPAGGLYEAESEPFWTEDP